MAGKRPLTLAEKKVLLKEKLLAKSQQDKTAVVALPAQQALWAFTMANPASPAYHLKFTARIQPAVPAELIANALAQLMKRHIVLRSYFEFKEGRLYQHFPEQSLFKLSAGSIDEAAISDTILHDYAQL